MMAAWMPVSAAQPEDRFANAGTSEPAVQRFLEREGEGIEHRAEILEHRNADTGWRAPRARHQLGILNRAQPGRRLH